MAEGPSGTVAEHLSSRKGTPGLVAGLLRDQITAGKLEPGAKIFVERFAQQIGVSANTLREALQLLENDRLVTQQLNRGIFVSRISEADIVDLYSMRRLLELGTLRQLTKVPQDSMDAMHRAVDDGYRALELRDWRASSQATIDFHSALVSSLHSERATQTMRRLMAELSLTLSIVHEAMEPRPPFLNVRRELLDLLDEGKMRAAETLLATYLDDGEALMLAMHKARDSAEDQSRPA
jgi:DNA-binding GntR family transcriptional regulator